MKKFFPFLLLAVSFLFAACDSEEAAIEQELQSMTLRILKLRHQAPVHE